MDNRGKHKKARAQDGLSKANKRESLNEGVPMLVFGRDTNRREAEIKSPSYDQQRYLKKDEPGYRIIVDKTFVKIGGRGQGRGHRKAGGKNFVSTISC